MPVDLSLKELVSESHFDESAYLEGNPDVAAAVAAGVYESGWAHFDRLGRHENRFLARPALDNVRVELASARQAKYTRYAEALIGKHEGWDRFLEVEVRDDGLGPVVHALPVDAVGAFGVVNTTSISEQLYDEYAESLIHRHADGLVLDCGAGARGRYLENVINLEIVAYPSTDIVAVAELIPLRDDAVDAVICSAVLEHVKRPWLAAAEISRILRPGGDLYVAVPFLQPLHGYPNHYFNMTATGLASLFEDFEVEWHEVIDSLHPIWALSWILRAWRDGLSGDARDQFEGMRVEELIGEAPTYLDQPSHGSCPRASASSSPLAPHFSHENHVRRVYGQDRPRCCLF